MLAVAVLGGPIHFDKGARARAAEVEAAHAAVVGAREQLVWHVRQDAHARDGPAVRLKGRDGRVIARADVPEAHAPPRVSGGDDELGRRWRDLKGEYALRYELGDVVLIHGELAEVDGGRRQGIGGLARPARVLFA